jgi:MFS family permease
VLWGVTFGCFCAAVNNFLVDIHAFNPTHRGWLEFFREMPGLCLVFILAVLHRMSDWKILRLGALISTASIILLCVPAQHLVVCAIILLWSVGEHVVMPIRSAVTMDIASEGKGGRALGVLSGVQNAGIVGGNVMVFLVFWLGAYFGFAESHRHALYNVVWVLTAILAFGCVLCTFAPGIPNVPSKRPRLFFHRKFSIYYALELFYGARKQIFLTFGPFVLVILYKIDTQHMAVIMAASACVNMFVGPWVGKLTDRFSYRTVMIADTLLLFWVCLLYGYAHVWFPANVAIAVVIVNFLLDAALSTTVMATNLYVKDIAQNPDEVTSTLSTGISVNHLISVIVAPLGGWVWMRYGVGTLFAFAAILGLAKSATATLIPMRRQVEKSSTPS